MRDLIERIETICSELGYTIIDREESEELYQSSFVKNDEIEGSLFVEKDSNFLEIAYTYTFDIEEEDFLKTHLETMMNICYEYGNYFNIMKGEDEINFSIFAKLYFSGLNVESMQDTFDDFIDCNHEIMEIFGTDEEESYEDFNGIEN
jgi:hypothetical protein